MMIVRVKLTLDDVEPKVLRRFEVPAAIRLDDLHLIIQAMMPWENYHLYQFRIRDVRWGIADPDFDYGDQPLDARTTTLSDVLQASGTKSLKYDYDFGDGWEHTLKIEKLVEAEPDKAYPCLLEAKGRCPPEDVGGPWGYQDYLAAMADPKHKNHADMVNWRGPDFNPDTVDLPDIEKALARIAKRLSAKPKAGPRKAGR